MNHLHPDHIDRLLRDHQITLQELADLLGIDPSNHVFGHPSRLPLAALAKLADLLGESPLGAQVAAGTQDGRQQLGSLLGHLPDGATRDHLASTLGWTLDELEPVLAHLDHELRANGLRLATTPQGRIRIVGLTHTLPPAARQRAAQPGIDPDPEIAHLIHRLIRYSTPVRHAETDTLDAAIAQGLITRGWGGRPRPTQAVLYSLCAEQRYR